MKWSKGLDEAGPALPGAATEPDEGPPPFGAWWRVYALVIAVLVAMILLCHALTRLGS